MFEENRHGWNAVPPTPRFHGFLQHHVKSVAYLRVSTPQQHVSGQRLAVLEYARKHEFPVDDFIEATASARASETRRRFDELMSALVPGDRLVVSEISRLGRSLVRSLALHLRCKGGTRADAALRCLWTFVGASGVALARPSRSSFLSIGHELVASLSSVFVLPVPSRDGLSTVYRTLHQSGSRGPLRLQRNIQSGTGN